MGPETYCRGGEPGFRVAARMETPALPEREGLRARCSGRQGRPHRGLPRSSNRPCCGTCGAACPMPLTTWPRRPGSMRSATLPGSPAVPRTSVGGCSPSPAGGCRTSCDGVGADPRRSRPARPRSRERDDALQAHDDLARALALVRRLPPDQADAVLLRIVAGMDVGQVAEVMGRSEGSVRVLVHRGLQRLREAGRASDMDVGVTGTPCAGDERVEMTEPVCEDSPHTIDAIVAALQSPAWAEELEGEEALVGAMAAAVVAIDHEEPASMTFRSRPLKLGLIAGVAVLSVAGVAAAWPRAHCPNGVPIDRSPRPCWRRRRPRLRRRLSTRRRSTPRPSTHRRPSRRRPARRRSAPRPRAVTPGTPDGVVQGPAANRPVRPRCPADVVNHGQYVSGVAHETPPGPGHGEVVSAVAQSDCGKDVGATRR